MKHISIKSAVFATVVLLSFTTPAAAHSPSAAQQIDGKPGQVVNVGDFAFVVLGWDEVKPSQFMKPEAGNKFIAVEAIAVNTGKAPVSISAFGQATLRDDESQKYDISLTAISAASLPQLTGVLLPGERIRGNLAFEVPTTAKALEFRFVPAMFGSDDELSVPLGDKLSKAPVPTSIKGETSQKLAKVGEALKIGDFNLTVNKASAVKAGIMKPAKGNRFIAVEVVIENTSKEKQALSTLLQTFVRDADGFLYDVSLGATATAKAKTIDGNLSAGDKIKGQVAFEVPTAAKGLVFEFVGDVMNNSKVLVGLPEIK